MKSIRLSTWLLIGLAIVVFLPLRIPASVLGAIVASETKGVVTLAAADGTFWQGSAQPLVDGEAVAERLQWKVKPIELLHGRLEFDLTLDDGSAHLTMGKGGLLLSNADLTVAGGPLFKLSDRTKAYALNGQLHLASPSLHFADGQPAGTLALDWRGAGSGLAPATNPLGDYHIDATPSGQGWHLQFSTLSGALLINGGGDWNANRGLTVDLSLKAAQGAEASLNTLLSQMGPGTAGGERRLQFNFR